MDCWIVVLILAIGMLFGKFRDVDFGVFTLTVPILLGGSMGLKGHQNHKKKQET